MNSLPQPRKLTSAQALLLRLFDRDLPETELTDLRQVLTKHFAKKAEAEAGRLLKANGQTANDIGQDTQAINENRTAYLRKVRFDKA